MTLRKPQDKSRKEENEGSNTKPCKYCIGNRVLKLYRNFKIEFKYLLAAVSTSESLDIDGTKTTDTNEMSFWQLRQEVFKRIMTQGKFCLSLNTHVYFHQVIATFDHDDIIWAGIYVFKMFDKKTEDIHF